MTTVGSMTRPLIPVDVLWPSDSRGPAHVSPDGRWVAHVETRDGVANAVVASIDGGQARQVTHLRDGHGIEDIRWAADSRHLLVVRDDGGDEDYRLDSIDVEDGSSRALVASPGVRALILGTWAGRPHEVAVGINDRDARFHDVYLVDLASGDRRLVAENPGFTRWVLDVQLAPRAGVRGRDDGGAELQVRDGDGWTTVLSVAAGEAMPMLFDLYPVRFTSDGAGIHYVGNGGADTLGLLRLDLATREVSAVARRDRGDVMWVLFDPSDHRPLVATVVTDRAELLACDPDLREAVELLTTTLDGDLDVVSIDVSGRWWTVAETRDIGSKHHHLFDRATGEVRLLYAESDALESTPLAPMTSASFTARDGLEIPVYLTFPLGESRASLPTVVMVHGGPANRYFWGYHPQVQFFADRGYLVVQVNYRGSLGYGRAFMAAGDGEWARAMHDDVVDAVNWVVAQGWADRERIGMWGTSYGGYETLITATHEPDLLRCAVPVVAPTNLVTLIQDMPDYWQAERAYFARVLGDLSDTANLWERSPLRLADRVRTPLLLMYGDNDPRVRPDQATELAAALDQTGADYELHIFAGEGHSLGTHMTRDNRAVYASRLERFLSEHLGGRSEVTT